MVDLKISRRLFAQPSRRRGLASALVACALSTLAMASCVAVAIHQLERPTMYRHAVTRECLAVVDARLKLLGRTPEESCASPPADHEVVYVERLRLGHSQWREQRLRIPPTGG